MATKFKYAAVNEAPIYKTVTDNKGEKVINKILLGTYVEIEEESGNFCKVITAGPDGWMNSADLTDKMGLKIFVLDVGQGDGILIEVGDLKIIIDGGPGKNLFKYLTNWQYSYILKEGEKINIDYLFISHFDSDHFAGILSILENESFTFRNIYHPGILKFASKTNTHDTGVGSTITSGGKKYLTTLFNNLLTATDPAPFNSEMNDFMGALKTALNAGRITGDVIRTGAGNTIVNKTIDDQNFRIDVLGPFTENVNNQEAYVYFNDESKTINGHSLILKVTFGKRTFLFSGDLNAESEKYLLGKYGSSNPFKVDVAKACHHGSSDFTIDFMKQIEPYATIISSGDNESYSHPRADAIGCAGKYSRGSRPLVFSTELARSVLLASKKILYGMINCRCNGNDIYISQMKEKKSGSDIWDSYDVK